MKESFFHFSFLPSFPVNAYGEVYPMRTKVNLHLYKPFCEWTIMMVNEFNLPHIDLT